MTAGAIDVPAMLAAVYKTIDAAEAALPKVARQIEKKEAELEELRRLRNDLLRGLRQVPPPRRKSLDHLAQLAGVTKGYAHRVAADD